MKKIALLNSSESKDWENHSLLLEALIKYKPFQLTAKSHKNRTI